MTATSCQACDLAAAQLNKRHANRYKDMTLVSWQSLITL